MKTDEIFALSVCTPVGLALILFLFHVTIMDADRLWPRGLRWFPPVWHGTVERLERAVYRIFWPEKMPLSRAQEEIYRLERLDREWRAHVGPEGAPEWRGNDLVGYWCPRNPRLPETDRFDLTSDLDRILTALSACPCGYTSECAVHCGDGHRSGSCPAHGVSALPVVLMER